MVCLVFVQGISSGNIVAARTAGVAPCVPVCLQLSGTLYSLQHPRTRHVLLSPAPAPTMGWGGEGIVIQGGGHQMQQHAQLSRY